MWKSAWILSVWTFSERVIPNQNKIKGHDRGYVYIEYFLKYEMLSDNRSQNQVTRNIYFTILLTGHHEDLMAKVSFSILILFQFSPLRKLITSRSSYEVLIAGFYHIHLISIRSFLLHVVTVTFKHYWKSMELKILQISNLNSLFLN